MWRSVSKRKEIENLFSETKYISGCVIGYTERKHDTENTRHHYAIIEYISDQNEVIWAENEGCNKGDYSIKSEVNLMYHPRDKRNVMIALSQDHPRIQANFEKNLGLSINILFTLFIFSSVAYYGHGYPILISFLLSYSGGFVFGAVTKNKNKREEDLRIQDSEARNKRLIAAQEKGEIPCYLKE